MNRSFLLASLMTAVAATAVHAADPENGKHVAEQWCISCHSPGSPGGAGLAVPFAVLVKKYRTEEIAAVWTRRHGSMPQIELKPRQQDDLLAYIAALRDAEGRAR